MIKLNNLISYTAFCVTLSTVFCHASDRSFSIDYDNDCFLKDGQPFSYVSGSIHYARVPDYYWRDRLLKMYAAGLNVIQTYVPWNAHEPISGVYDFSGSHDLVKFLTTAHDIGLLVVLRAGPYMCGEWEFGGLPAWLLKENSSVVLRSTDPQYLKPVDRWFDVLLPKLKPLLYENGGPIILTQLENEYGSFFTCSRDYLTHLRDRMRAHLGPRATLITTDGAGLGYLKCGAVGGVYATVDFGPGNATSGFSPMRAWNPRGPLVNSEFYTGWLDHWGSAHAHGNTLAIVKTLTQILAMNASVNMYMFEGGTNFGYMNGVNSPFQPVPTSYDYDAPLTEAGDPTSKYMAIRAAIGKFRPLPKIPVPPATPKAAYGSLNLTFMATVYDALELITEEDPVMSTYPLSQEQISQNYGFTLYRHVLKSDYSGHAVKIPGLRDRAHVLLDGQPVTLLDRNEVMTFNLVARQGQRLDFIVENMGRINYGKDMIGQRKGIISNVTVKDNVLTDWTIYPLNLSKVFEHKEQLRKRPFRPTSTLLNPAFYEASFVLPSNQPNDQPGYQPNNQTSNQPKDTYVSLPGWTKGQLLINGHNLGRYWPARGPQKTLYVPGGVLHPPPATNTLVLLELDSAPCDLQRVKVRSRSREMSSDRNTAINNIDVNGNDRKKFGNKIDVNGNTVNESMNKDIVSNFGYLNDDNIDLKCAVDLVASPVINGSFSLSQDNTQSARYRSKIPK